MLSRNFFGEQLSFALNILFYADHKLLKLVFSLEGLNFELFSFFWLDFVDVHCLVDVAEIIAEIFFLIELGLDFFKTFVEPDKIIDIVDLFPEAGGFLIEPGVECIGVLFEVGGYFLFEFFRQVSHEVNGLVFHFL